MDAKRVRASSQVFALNLVVCIKYKPYYILCNTPRMPTLQDLIATELRASYHISVVNGLFHECIFQHFSSPTEDYAVF